MTHLWTSVTFPCLAVALESLTHGRGSESAASERSLSHGSPARVRGLPTSAQALHPKQRPDSMAGLQWRCRPAAEPRVLNCRRCLTPRPSPQHTAGGSMRRGDGPSHYASHWCMSESGALLVYLGVSAPEEGLLHRRTPASQWPAGREAIGLQGTPRANEPKGKAGCLRQLGALLPTPSGTSSCRTGAGSSVSGMQKIRREASQNSHFPPSEATASEVPAPGSLLGGHFSGRPSAPTEQVRTTTTGSEQPRAEEHGRSVAMGFLTAISAALGMQKRDAPSSGLSSRAG